MVVRCCGLPDAKSRPMVVRLCQLKSCLFLLTLLCTLQGSLYCQSGANGQTKQRQPGAQEASRIARATRVDHAPKLDGTLDDPLWQQATPIAHFLQREPYEGQAAT